MADIELNVDQLIARLLEGNYKNLMQFSWPLLMTIISWMPYRDIPGFFPILSRINFRLCDYIDLEFFKGRVSLIHSYFDVSRARIAG